MVLLLVLEDDEGVGDDASDVLVVVGCIEVIHECADGRVYRGEPGAVFERDTEEIVGEEGVVGLEGGWGFVFFQGWRREGFV